MRHGKERLSRRRQQIGAALASKAAGLGFALWVGCALLCSTLLSGCASFRTHVEKNLMNDMNSTTRTQGVAACYRIACPDELEIEAAGRREVSGRKVVAPDGRIELAHYGRPRVEGRTLGETAQIVAESIGAEPIQVRVRVAHFRSEQVYLFGQVIGWQRAVPYQGQETVLDLLQRVGGITPGAAPSDVLVVRPHIVDGKKPEVFHVDLAAIVLKHDMASNLRLEPQDQVYVGETRQARVERSLPPWMRPLYQRMWDTRPTHKGPLDSDGTPWVTGNVEATKRQN
jgi:protein involved in polysaccharide export with SLBB domain